MNYKFDKDSLEVINRMIFDASVNVEDLSNLKVQDKIQFELERRTFEDVERKKFLFWDRTVFKGKLSQLIINGVRGIMINNENKKSSSNVFVQELVYENSSETLKLITTELTFELNVSSNLTGELIDIKDSSFGAKGLSIGRFGFTKQEWADYLHEKNYHASSRANG